MPGASSWAAWTTRQEERRRGWLGVIDRMQDDGRACRDDGLNVREFAICASRTQAFADLYHQDTVVDIWGWGGVKVRAWALICVCVCVFVCMNGQAGWYALQLRHSSHTHAHTHTHHTKPHVPCQAQAQRPHVPHQTSTAQQPHAPFQATGTAAACAMPRE